MSFHRGPKIVTEGLVLYLDAANTKSYPGTGTVVSDLSGNGNDSTLGTDIIFDTTNKGLFKYNGVAGDGGDRILTLYPITYGFNLVNQTITFWAKCDKLIETSEGGGFNNWIAQFGAYYNNNSGGFGLQAGNFGAYLKASTASGWSYAGYSDSAKTIYTQYDWVLYTLIITATNPILYMNETKVFDITITDPYTSYAYDSIVFGRDMGMKLSNVRIHDGVLSPEQILQNYNATKSRFL